MRLKRLETYGFKSFADRMAFDFEDGITAIIGPNGSGKSNVVDAIKWVIGEQSAKALRGHEMADVIFNGCASRRPMALAEVTLVLDGLGLAKGLAEDEVAITRRLTRDGHSSYYLNGRQVRLRDIRELLLDTGMGTSAYAVIEQGRIGFILEASTKDRRAILEEAAGIARYKAHRRQAGRRLERARLDCERIGQVLGEVDKRLRAVTRQAETAQRYRELEARLRDLRMVFALEEWRRLSADAEGLTGRDRDLEDAGAELAARLAELEAALSDDEQRLTAFEDELLRTQRIGADAQSRRDVADARRRDAEARLGEIAGQEREEEAGIANGEERIAVLREERERAAAALPGPATAGDEQAAAYHREKERELADCRADLDRARGEAEDLQRQAVACLQELSRVEAEEKRLAASRDELGLRRERLEERRAAHDRRIAAGTAAEEELRGRQAELAAAVEDIRTGLEELIRTREEHQAGVAAGERRLNEVEHRLGRSEERLDLLNQYEAKAEGVQRGARNLLEQDRRIRGILGLVADRCRVPAAYEAAIEAALGPAAQDVICEDAAAAEAAVAWLRDGEAGRATLLPLDGPAPPRAEGDWTDVAGTVGLAVDLVEYEERFAPVVRHLLGDVLVLEDLGPVPELRRRGVSLRLVTLDGEIRAADGTVTGGRDGDRVAGGLVGRKNEIARLEEELATLAEERRTTAEALDASRQDAFAAGAAVAEQRRRLAAREEELAKAGAALAKAEGEAQHHRAEAGDLERDAEEIEAGRRQVENDAVELAGQRDWFGARRARIEHDLEAKRAAVEQLGERRDRLQDELARLRANLASSEERRESARLHLRHLDDSLAAATEGLAERRRRLDALAERRGTLREQIAGDRDTHAAAAAECERLAAAVNEHVGRRDDLRESIEARRGERRGLNDRLRTIEQERQDLAIKLSEIAVRKEDLAQRIADEFEIDLAAAFADWERPAELDLPAVRRELDETEAAIKRLGTVNLAAIDELAAVRARQEFLAGQHGDLTEAVAKLERIITGIDDTCRKRFRETYRSVRKNFQELFRKLFGGGRADMVLETAEGEDILEAGIEIIAQPPAKQPKAISLLSGGEKALSAIALLFAVYRSKPSPLCVLDEVDAPLDETNTDIYCQMLTEFCAHSQFLVITHNKRSMQYADALYGITHAEPGVSTKISVKLQELDGDTDPLAAVASQGPYGD